jgi:hypothetical protein
LRARTIDRTLSVAQHRTGAVMQIAHRSMAWLQSGRTHQVFRWNGRERRRVVRSH